MTKSLHHLHQSGTFVLVNVHDVGSAALAEAAGAEALGTTSGGHAYTIGRPDAVGAISRDESIERAAAICAAVDIPVSIDAENGWGHTPKEVADTITALHEVGAAGASIEDWSGDSTIGFYDKGLAVERIAAAVEAARNTGGDFVICARADQVMHEGPDAFAGALDRLQAFAAAGAGCLYAPGVDDEPHLRTLAAEAGGPINALLSLHGPTSVPDAAAWGVRRVSLGSSLYQATMAAFTAMVREAVGPGTLRSGAEPLDYAYIEGLFE